VRNKQKEQKSSNRRRAFLLGWLIWTAWGFANAAILNLQENVFFVFALLGGLESSYIMGMLSLGVWALVKHLSWENRKQKLVALLAHLLTAPIFSALWMALYVGMNVLLFGEIMMERMRVKDVGGWMFFSGMTEYAVVAGVFHAILMFRRFQEKAVREAELQLLANRMELAQLKSQLNPHFLFNTLNSINALIGSDPEAARRMLARLAEILRYALDSDRETTVPLRDEVRFVETYLDIEQARFGDRLYIRKEIDENLLDAPVPPMLLQPLVENAVQHGITPLEDGGEITIRIQGENRRMRFEVFDTGNGVSGSVTDLGENGIGLRNTDQRLRKMFGETAGLHLEKHAGGFRVSFSIPIQEPGKS
jgi:sensor histidine kinase YesM